MEAAALSTSSSSIASIYKTRAVKFLTTFPSTRTSPPNPWPPTKHSTILTLHSSNPTLRTTFLSLTRCSIKPNTDTENEPGLSSAFEPDSNAKTLNPSTPDSNKSNKSHSTSSSSTTSTTTRGLVLDLGPANSWDSADIGSPVVKRFLSDDEERWCMWYHGSSTGTPSSDSIGLAVSSNGIHWERGGTDVKSSEDVGLVMKRGEDWWAFDTERIRPSEVVIMSSSKIRVSSSVYWLYYTGYTSEKVDLLDDSISRSLPGLAISQDGRHWARIEGDHHTGALFDTGSEKEWDSSFIAKPQVVYHEKGDLRMYYHSFDSENGEFGIGLARSRDGINWVKLGKIIGGGGRRGCFDEIGALNACVAKNKKGGNYVMAYEGIGEGGVKSIGLAVSLDGLKDWRRLRDDCNGDAVVLTASGHGGWDNIGVGSPCLVQMDGDLNEWRLYYRGIGDGGRSGIGMAVSEGNELTRFERWSGFSF